jgi:hypothetical protein
MADTDHIGQSDHDLIVSMFTTLNRIDKTVFGNGQPGLLSDHTALKQEVREVRTDLQAFVEAKVEEAKQENVVVVAEAKETLKRETPGKGGQRYAQITATVAVLVAVVQGVLAAFKG